MRIMINTLLAALIVAGAAELGKRFSFMAALLIALPTTSILALSFLYADTKDITKVTALSYGIFWLVLPTLLFFLLLPLIMKTGLNYWASLAASAAVMVVVFTAYVWVLKRFGVQI